MYISDLEHLLRLMKAVETTNRELDTLDLHRERTLDEYMREKQIYNEMLEEGTSSTETLESMGEKVVRLHGRLVEADKSIGKAESKRELALNGLRRKGFTGESDRVQLVALTIDILT